MTTSRPASAPLTPILLVLVTGFLLAGMDSLAKWLSAAGLPVLLVLWGRYFFHAFLTFIGYAVARRSVGFLRARHPGLQFVRAACLFGGTSSLYFSLQHLDIAEASSIQFLAPVLITAISGMFLGEHVGPRRWIAVMIAFAGVLVVARPGSGVLGFWALLPFITAVLLAIYMILTRTIRSKDDPATTTFYSTAVGAVALTIMLPAVWEPVPVALWPFIVLTGAAGAAGHYLLVRAFQVAEASMLAPFTYSQVVAAVFWGVVIFGAIPSVWTIVGASMIVGSGIYVWYRESLAAKRGA